MQLSADRTIYIVHGWAIDPNNESKWHEIRTILEAQGVRSVFIALPGLSTPLSQVWTLDDYAHWLYDQLNQEGKVVALGHSFGGQLLVRCNALYPDLFSQLFLVDSAGIVDKTLKKRLKRGFFGFLAKVGKHLPFKEKARKVLYLLARERDYYLAPEIQKKTMSNVIMTDITKELSLIKVPTTIIWGEHDLVTPLRHASIFNTLIPKSQLRVIAGARHSPIFTHPELVANIILGQFK